MERMITVAACLTFLLSACSPAAAGLAPDPTQIEATTIAQANALLTPTQPADGTSAPVTAMPSPGFLNDPASPTPPPIPTLVTGPLGASTNVATDCIQPFDLAAAGPTAPVVIKNNTESPITIAMGLGARNSLGQCGYLSWENIPTGATMTVSVPEINPALGDPCYWINAWINDSKHRAPLSDGGFCIDGPHKWVINVNYNRIRLTSR